MSDSLTQTAQAKEALEQSVDKLLSSHCDWLAGLTTLDKTRPSIEAFAASVDALIAAVLADHDAQTRPDWQPIETAPKDGATGILVTNGSSTRVCSWCETLHEWAWYQRKPGAPIVVLLAPTHWMPLPDPPAQKGTP